MKVFDMQLTTLIRLLACGAYISIQVCTANAQVSICRTSVDIGEIRVYAYPITMHFRSIRSQDDVKLSAWSYKDTIVDATRIRQICAVISQLPFKEEIDEAYSDWRSVFDIMYSNGEQTTIGIDDQGCMHYGDFIFEDSYFLLKLLGIACIRAE